MSIRTARRAASIVLRSIAAVAVALPLLAGLATRMLPVQVLYVRSGSMAPGMPIGSLALFTQASATDLRVGDVIAFDRPDMHGVVVTHRIAAFEHVDGRTQIITKGDANAETDPWRVTAAGSGSRRVANVPFAGYVLGYTQAILALPWVLPMLLWGGVAMAMAAIWRRPRREQLPA